MFNVSTFECILIIYIVIMHQEFAGWITFFSLLKSVNKLSPRALE